MVRNSGLAILALCVPAALHAEGPALNGEALFHEKCAMCHGAVGMGTGLLARRIQPAELTARTDLAVPFIVTFARLGLGNMPAITRGEVSDAQLRAIAEYLSRTAEPAQ